MADAYHGTPITSAGNRVLEAMGARAYCVSAFRDDQVQWVNDNAAPAAGDRRKWFGDNGIFSFWMAALRAASAAGVRFDGVTYTREDFDRFVAWARRWCLEGTCSWVVIPDPIGTSTQELDAWLRQWPADLKDFGVPVWHTDEPIDRAIRLLEAYGRLCVGAVAEHAVIGSPAFVAVIDELWDEIYRAFGREAPWVHMFRSLQLLDPKWEWPFAGHDSTDLARNHHRTKAFGDRYLWAVKQKADRWDRLAANRPTLWTPRDLRQHELFEGRAA